MACRSTNKLQKKREFRRKLRNLRNLIKSNSNDATTIMRDALLCIVATTEKIKKINKELEAMDCMKHVEYQLASPLEVKVKEHGHNQFQLNVRSANEGGNNYLALIAQALEGKAIQFISTSVKCSVGFEMEAIVEVTQAMDSSALSEVVINAIEKSVVTNK